MPYDDSGLPAEEAIPLVIDHISSVHGYEHDNLPNIPIRRMKKQSEADFKLQMCLVPDGILLPSTNFFISNLIMFRRSLEFCLHDLCLTLIAYKEGTPLLVYQKNQEETSTIEIDIGLRKMMDIYRGRPELIIWQELWRMYREQLDDHFNKIRGYRSLLIDCCGIEQLRGYESCLNAEIVIKTSDMELFKHPRFSLRYEIQDRPKVKAKTRKKTKNQNLIKPS